MPNALRMLVSHSTRDTNVRVFWRFIEELQTAIDQAALPLILVNIVSECGSVQVSDLPQALTNATAATDATMMVLTQGYIDSAWCDDEMHARARSACADCPSRRLFPLSWRTYPWPKVWSRTIDGWGIDLQHLITTDLLAQVEARLWQPAHRPADWRHAINLTVDALRKFVTEIDATCTGPACPNRVVDAVPIPSRRD